jgi:signal transduction histidine kinase
MFLGRAAEDEHRQQRLEVLEHAAREGLAESLHELKAPLHAAAGFLDLVASEQTGPLNDLQKDFLETARGECARLKDALASLVEVSASAAGRRTVDVGAVDPGEVVVSAVDRMRGAAQQRQLHLVPRVAPDTAPVVADPVGISQVLTNFLQNAMRLSPPGSEIEVAARGEAGWTHFEVADRGPGVPSEQLETIFERYQQGGGSTQREAGTVGLGLAISRRIVEQHHGRIWAENRADGGARFCFALPAAA